jgi:hypothetical protein
MSNEKLYEKAMEAISELFGDVSVSKSTTRENLNTLLAEIQVMIEALGDDEE